MTHYSRARWGGRPPRGRNRLDPLEVKGVALHWPAMAKPLTTPEAVMAALRGWQDYHMDARGWSDIAYQLAIDSRGNTYGLRGIRYRSAANGDTGPNAHYGAILLVVAPGEDPTPAMVAATRSKVASMMRLYPVMRRADQPVVTHNDVRPEPTACPGPAVTRLIRAGAFNPRK